MARYTEAVCRFCRREGEKLFLKGTRCFDQKKCSFERRNYAPGQHGQRRTKVSDYGLQLRQKQKIKRMYGLLEGQFRGYYFRACRQKGVTGTNLLVLLERRLDNVAFQLGFAITRSQARQLVRHSHVRVNGKKVSIPSYLVKVGDVISVVDASRKITPVLQAKELAASRPTPNWLKADRENFTGTVEGFPVREDITHPMNEQLVIELYSK